MRLLKWIIKKLGYKAAIAMASFVLLLVSAPQAHATLWNVYQDYELPWETVSQRAPTAAEFGIFGYRGTAEQNQLLEKRLREFYGDTKLGFSVSSRYRTTLSSSMTSSQSTVPVASIATFDGHTLTMADLGSVVFLTIEPGSAREEIVKCTAISSSQWSTCTRGLAFYGTTETAVTANQKAHNAGSVVVMSNVHYVYEQLADKDSDETIAGLKTYSTYPRINSYAAPTVDEQFAVKKYVDDTISAGAPDATETVKGISELATGAEASAGTSSGSAARLVIPASIATSTCQVAGNYIPVTASDGKIVNGCLDQTENYAWSGTNTHSGTNSFSNTTTFNGQTNSTATSTVSAFLIARNMQAMTASTTITGYTTPQPIRVATSTESGAGAVKLSDANDTNALAFDGFAVSSATNGNTVYVQQEGIVSGFTGLTAGATYYVQDAVGTIGTTPGTYAIKVGIAISTTQVLIQTGAAYRTGQATRTNAESTGNQVVVHNLGRLPTSIVVHYFDADSVNNIIIGVGTATSASDETTTWAMMDSVVGNNDVETGQASAMIAIRTGNEAATDSGTATLSAVAENSFTLNWTTAVAAGFNQLRFQWEVR